jgi:hypothetical protein
MLSRELEVCPPTPHTPLSPDTAKRGHLLVCDIKEKKKINFCMRSYSKCQESFFSCMEYEWICVMVGRGWIKKKSFTLICCMQKKSNMAVVTTNLSEPEEGR